MKAVILAAGQGTRLMPHTADRPKCLVELHGRPLISWQTAALHAAGITDILAVTGYCADQVSIPGVRTKHNPRFAETNMVASLFSAEQELDGDVLIAYGDIVYRPQIVTAMLHNPAAISVAVDLDWLTLWRLRMEDPLTDAETLKLSPGGEIVEIGKKPQSLADIEGQYIGLVFVRAQAWPRIKSFYRELDRNARYDGRSFDQMFMTTFLSLIIERLFPVAAATVRGGWCEVDSARDLEVYQQTELSFLRELERCL